jgi:hypothetical protein
MLDTLEIAEPPQVVNQIDLFKKWPGTVLATGEIGTAFDKQALVAIRGA